ncbi:unnamed protein product [Effrenium voratum]|uniref:J domain-containing protein n=1 Tax=Effrenium voratum TaxID=2562239 RepID=A0AA36I2U8_9DINO|nr:unnamed protein product [Effrenium voratum]CAJ1379717.1 unnamed protein product [Effrenium voratum]CAJ1453649.1 unnamed protein product [Effrenium voratum]
MRHTSHGSHALIGCFIFLGVVLGCWKVEPAGHSFVHTRPCTKIQRCPRLFAFFQGDGFRPDETIPFTQSSANDEAQEKGTRRKGGVDEIDEDSEIFNTGVFNPYEILDLSPMDEIGEDELRAAFRKQAKKYHPDVPKTGDAEKFQLIKRAVEELASLGMLGEWKGKMPSANRRKERGQTVSEDYWELRGRDFFAELETELTDELKMRFNESDKDLTNAQIRARMRVEDDYWEELRIRQGDKLVLERVEDWMQRKREQRRLLLRQRLRGIVPEVEERSAQASHKTLSMVENRIAQWLGLPEKMLSLDMTLDELGFFDDSSWDDVAVCLMLLEEEFEADIVNVVEKKGQSGKVQLPDWVGTIEDFADFVESKL